ncbi:MAG: beta-N-acetylhexosaminidase [Rikenellaceae bacterium]
MKKVFTLLASFLLLSSCCGTDSYISDGTIIPKPQQQSYGEGSFEIGRKVEIITNCEEGSDAATFLSDLFQRSSNKKVSVAMGEEREGAINIILDSAATSQNSEGYSLEVAPSGVTIKSATKAGLFYGVQSLRQLMPASIESDVKLKDNDAFKILSTTVVDYPRFGWRGYMKDVSRTFFGVDVIKDYLDVMSLYKLNVFHFHLSDDQGWRVEIKRYPELTTPQTTIFPDEYNQPAERSGFYTQEEIKEIVAYAAARNITVVPEIDVPGHSWATLLVYPELGVNDNHTPNHVFPFCSSWGHWGNQFTPNTLDPTNEKVYEFLDGVFTEIAELFPSEYIHFGGDEVMHKFWTEEAHVKAFMKKKGFKNVHALQSYFVERVADIIISKGRKPIGWNDILEDPNLTKESAIMCWLGKNAIVQAANEGYYSVATPSHPLYLDITQSDRNDGTMCDLNYKIINSIEAIYNYNPTAGVTPDKEHFVLGVQANMWPAVPQELKDVNVQNFPRLFALAEIAWSNGDDKDFEAFSLRVDDAKRRLDYLGIDYYTEGGYILSSWTPADITTEYQAVEWDVTAKVTEPGRITAGLHTTEGDDLEIEKVELLENGAVVSVDEHYAVSPVTKNIFRPYNYYLTVENYNPKATYTLRATIKGKGDANSTGNVTFSLYPYSQYVK